MRDVHRLKEKFELSLDSRQIVSLTVVGLVIVGAVFVLGVVVGKKLAADDQVAQAPDLLTAIDQKAVAMTSLQKDASLTFQEELTRKTTPVVVEAPVVVAPKPSAEPKKPEEKKPEAVAVKPAEPAPAAAPVAPPPPEPLVAEAPKPEAKPAEVAVAPAPAEPKPEPTPAAKPVEAIPTRTHDAGAMRDAFARASKPATPETSADGQWTLQLSAYQDRGEADRFMAGLKDKGYAPYIVEAQVPGKGTWFRVRMGRFPSKDAAGRYLSDFKRETSIDAFATPAK